MQCGRQVSVAKISWFSERVRSDPPEFAQFLKVAKGSLGETQNHLLHGKQQKYFSGEEFPKYGA